MTSKWIAALAVLGSWLLWQCQAVPPRAVGGFRWKSEAVPVGRVLHYAKSNLDGSNPSEIVLRRASETRLEVLKFHNPGDDATLVVAEMDWPVFSVRSFLVYRLVEGQERELVADLTTTPDRKRMCGTMGASTIDCELPPFPWHSYDFDFSSLNVTLPFLMEPEGVCTLEIVDPVKEGDTRRLVAKGSVLLRFEADERRGALDCRRYTLDGPGLEQRGGSVWVSRTETPFLVAFELDLPDEPGMQSGRLEWTRTEVVSDEEWNAFVEQRGQR
jgi:hypothetical protein